ncbi:hypothetical protein IC235_02655 [Hymenobacter sp. BT664]|uniref:Uncharacterized protein n=1 Tax=Hymenobacter montanus TaxID=2771359 RepID=A0A927B9U4_9BACT|nr:hypothetical protein [Hymenobacter montanus]
MVGNLNNHIDVPLTLFRLRANKHDFAVLEMGQPPGRDCGGLRLHLTDPLPLGGVLQTTVRRSKSRCPRTQKLH